MASVTGGDKLNKKLGYLATNLGKSSVVKVGFLEGSQERDGKPSPLIGFIQEFGAPKKGIPPRPYFRTMISQHSGEWPAELIALMKANDYDAAKSLDQLGQEIASELKKSIIDINDPPLSPVTVMLRGMRTRKQFRDLPFWERFAIAKDRVAKGKSNYGASTKPLIDTGALYENVDYVVKD